MVLSSFSNILGSGYLSNVAACPGHLRNALRESYWGLYTVLVKKIETSTPEIVNSILKILNIKLEEKDRRYIMETNVFKTLLIYIRSATTTSLEESNKAKKSSWTVLSSLISQVLKPTTDEAPLIYSNRVSSLFELLSKDIEAETANIHNLRTPLDNYLNRAIGLFLSCYQGLKSDTKAEILRVVNIKIYFKILSSSPSARTIILSIQALHALLGLIFPEDLPQDFGNNQNQTLVQFLFNIVAELILPLTPNFRPNEDINFTPPNYSTFSSFSRSQILNECINLLRTLRKDEKWSNIVKDEVASGLNSFDALSAFFNEQWNVENFTKLDSQIWTNYVKFLATCAVYGGYAPVFHSGGKVRTQKGSGNYLGDPNKSYQTNNFGFISDGKYENVTISQLLPVDEVSYPLQELIPSDLFFKFLTLSNPHPKRVVDGKGKVKNRFYRYLYSNFTKMISHLSIKAVSEDPVLLKEFVENNGISTLLKNIEEIPNELYNSEHMVPYFEQRMVYSLGSFDYLQAFIGKDVLFVHGYGVEEELEFACLNPSDDTINGNVVLPYTWDNLDINNEETQEIIIHTEPAENIASGNICLVKLESEPKETNVIIDLATQLATFGARAVILYGFKYSETFVSNYSGLLIPVPVFVLDDSQSKRIENLVLKFQFLKYLNQRQKLPRLDNLYESNEIFATKKIENLKKIQEKSTKGDDLKPSLPKELVDTPKPNILEEFNELLSKESNPFCGSETGISEPIETSTFTDTKEEPTSFTKALRINDSLFSEIHSRTEKPLTSCLSLINNSVYILNKRNVLIHSFSNWPVGSQLTLEKIGDPELFSIFLMNYAKDESPETFLSNPSQNHKLYQFIEGVNTILSEKDNENVKIFAQILFKLAYGYLFKDESYQYTAFLFVKHVILNHTWLFSQDLPKLHLAILKLLWNPDKNRSRFREEIFGVLKSFVLFFIEVDEGVEVSKKVLFNYRTLLSHLKRYAKNDGNIETSYIHSLTELMVLSEKLIKKSGDLKDETPPEPFMPPSMLLPFSVNAECQEDTVISLNEGICLCRAESKMLRIPNFQVGYFEIEIVETGGNDYLTVGVIGETIEEQNFEKMVGCFDGTCGFHADDGAIYANNVRQLNTIGNGARQGDFIGVGVDFEGGKVFFTKNGEIGLSVDFSTSNPLYGTCGVKFPGQKIRFNWGADLESRPFKFNLSNYVVSQSNSNAEIPPYLENLIQLDKLMDGIIECDVTKFGDDLNKKMFSGPAAETIIETPHNYPDNYDMNWEYSYPGADHLTLNFDNRCRSENTYDYLEIFMGPGRTQPFPNDGFKYMGRDDTSNWPRSPVVVPSNKIWLFFHSDGSNNDWGFRVTIQAPVNKDDPKRVNYNEKILQFINGWTVKDDFELCKLSNIVVDKENIDKPWNSVMTLTEKFKNYYSKEEFKDKNLPVDLYCDRLPVINMFNSLLEKTMAFFNLALKDPNPKSLLGRLHKLRPLIFDGLKTTFFYNILSKSNTGDQPEVAISKIKALRALDSGDIDNTVFGQIGRYCKNRDFVERLKHSEQAWKTKLASEGATDAGGPYRETFSIMSGEIHSPNHILALCPNGKFNIGQNRDKFLLRPSFNSPSQLDHYRFLGVLIGITLRTKGTFIVNLPSLIWKSIINEPTTIQDFEQIDSTCVKGLDSIRNIDQTGITSEEFQNTFFETFTTYLTDGTQVELVSGGRNIDLTFENRHEFCDLVMKTQMGAYDKQVKAIREGISYIVPINIIDALFTCSHIETLVCGKAQMDIELLKSQTEYSLDRNDERCRYLWQILSELTPEQQSLFLKFCWGRNRLPLSVVGFNGKKFKIESLSRGGNPDTILPEACTCFFTLKIPLYTNIDVMRLKLIYAIYNCVAIDMDQEAVDRSEWRE